ncbi:LamG-like jellyroll fold domain-containing protein [Microbacterium halotolerans]|uniref:LamG-like jellyroll fold domain-containing protein n=1 Tax=Microbacterium halotolerans TaxID=246613 RepID=UPI0013C31EBA|nr:LamG-like jellyroll fold domain-containing protein [Microbacterium halotolerans]
MSIRSRRSLRAVGATTGGALLAAALAPIAAAPAAAAEDLPAPLAQFAFDEAPTDGEFASGGATAAVNGTASLVASQEGQGTAAEIGSDFWLEVTGEDGGSLLAGLDQATISYDSLPAASGNTGWTVYAAASADPPTYQQERYVGLIDDEDGVTVERYNNSGARDSSGNLAATGLTGEWKHVDLVLDGDSAKLYVDQQLVDANAEGPMLTEILGDGGILQLGKANWGGGEYFSGLLDNVTIYSEALTSTQLGLPAPESVVVSGDDVTSGAVELWQGEQTQLTAKVTPEGAEGTVTWSSADAQVAAVSASGAVSAVSGGTTTITAAAVGDPTLTDEVTVTVNEVTDDVKAQRDADALAIENADDMRGTFSLPTIGTHGSDISWEIVSGSEHATITEGVNDSSVSAEVRRPAAGGDAAAIELVATVTAGETALTREFTVSVQPMPADLGNDEAYVWAFFTGEGVGGEEISLAASKGDDALDWNTLNEGEPLFTSHLGEEGLRDPFILRSPDGDTFYMIATDLKIDGRDGGFMGAQTHGSLAVEVWESNDLVNWSDQRHITVSTDYAGNTWAPEAYWDDERETFVMYWASNLYDTTDPADRTSPNYNRMMYATTDDFIAFSEPQVWIDVDRRGQAGAGSIDVTVAEHEGDYYRVYKDENSMTLRQERSSDLLAAVEGSYPSTTGADDEWVEQAVRIGAGQDNGYGGTFTQSEGPSLFPANEGDVNGYDYYLFADQPGYHGGPNHYVPMATNDITDGGAWQVIGDEMPQSQFPQNADGGMPRHGTIVPVTREQYHGVLEAFAPELAVVSVDAIDVSTQAGQAPALPEVAHLVKASGDTEDAEVVWDDIPEAAYAEVGTFTVVGVAQDDSRQPVEATVTVTEREADIEIEAATRCVFGRNVLVTTVSNSGAEATTVSVSTPYGSKDAVTVAAGASASQSFSTRSAEIAAGSVTAESAGGEATATYSAASCG